MSDNTVTVRTWKPDPKTGWAAMPIEESMPRAEFEADSKARDQYLAALRAQHANFCRTWLKK